MKRLLFPLCLLVFLVGAPSAMAADVPIPNGSADAGSGNEATGWGQSKWGTSTAVFTRPSTGAHSGTHSLRVDISGYTEGDAKWSHTPVSVTGGKYYKFSDWYKSNADTAVSMYWQTADQATREPGVNCDVAGQPTCGTWSNLETGIEPAAGWTKFESGIDMPAGAVQATFMHFIARNGFLQTDDYALEQLDSPLGFKRPLVSLTFDDSTPNLYNYVIPELDKRGYKSTQYVVTGATGARDDAGVLYQWSASQIKDVHQRGHEIGSHTEYHPNLAMPGPKAVCRSAGTLPTFTAVPAGGCPAGQVQETKNGSWLDPFGGTNLWLRPSTIGSPTQNLADTTLAQELGDSKRKLEDHIGYGVPTIAYPFGSYDSTVVAEEKARGYKAGRSVDEGYNSKIGLNPFKIKVQNIQQAVCTKDGVVTKADRSAGEDTPVCPTGSTLSADTTTKQFKEWVQKAKANNYWLVLVYHPVDDLGVNPYGTSTKRFAEQMQAIKDAGIEVKTMRDAPQRGHAAGRAAGPSCPLPRTFRAIRVRSPVRSPGRTPTRRRITSSSRRRRSTRRPSPRRRRPRPRTRSARRSGSAPRRAARIAAVARCGRATSAWTTCRS